VVLVELRAEHYAVIDSLAVEFGPGLNLLTGETGAGKSILVDALALLLGEKASPDVIRHGADKAVLAAVFQPEDAVTERILEANGISCEPGDPVLIRREIASGGKGRVFVNNQPATVAVLRLLAPSLAVIHAQNESILSFDAAARLALLDQFAGADTTATTEAFAAWNALRMRIAELERDEQDRLRLVDLWSFQKKEIESAHPEAGEDDRLVTEKRVLANAEKIYSTAMSAYDLLYEGAGSTSASLLNASKQLEELARYDEKFREAVAALDSARIAVDDVSATVRDYAGGINASPERLAEIEDRLAVLDGLKRKYGQSLDQVIAFGADVARKLDEVENRDDTLRRLRKELETAAQNYLTAARALSRKRFAAAKELQKLVEAEINDLAMKVTFRVQVGGSDEPANWTSSGFDLAQFMIITNPGEPLRPVEQIASGGELSRVMLALKASVEAGARRGENGGGRGKRKATIRTLVFDEIDAGIGGRAAEAVGKKLKALARHHQVLCVTHLPQIASFADQHFCIEKHEAGGRTRISIKALNGSERTHEIARMLSGAKLTDTSLKHAEQMLKANA
jgi:DNA repair protein RecN (Recombination protein N)